MVKRYVPTKGDLVWLDFDPNVGREQAGHRPAVVLTDSGYNFAAGLMLCVPVTTKIKDYPFEVELGGDVRSAALVDQISSMDWKARNAVFIRKIDDDELEEIQDKAKKLILGDLAE